MKKIFLALFAALLSVTAADAQLVKVYKNGTLVNTYTNTDQNKYKVTFEAVPNDNHEYVEIDGLKWATMNIDATTVASSSDESYGGMYHWGGKYFAADRATVAKDACTNGVLKLEYDEANIRWGGSWRMPTVEDFAKLDKACGGSGELSGPVSNAAKKLNENTNLTEGGIYWLNEAPLTIDGVEYKVKGMLFVTTADPKKRLFFPAAGYSEVEGDVTNPEYECRYWTSTLADEKNDQSGFSIFMSGDRIENSYALRRAYWLSIRPVSE